jgi:[acyl-carrier-protein] S-malonyltransferase
MSEKPSERSKKQPPAERPLHEQIPAAAFAFRGYNITNLGRSAELLEIPAYAPIVEEWLRLASDVSTRVLKRPVDLIARVRRKEETSLDTYGDAIALILAMETAQMHLLRQFFGIELSQARLVYGYSLGEVGALIAAGAMDLSETLGILLALSQDCAGLAEDVTMGVMFSRTGKLPLGEIRSLCLDVNRAGKGVIGMSSILSPNSVLLLGQHDTVDEFKRRMTDLLPGPIHLRKNPHHWPPMHTPIFWQKGVPDRAGVLLHTAEVNSPTHKSILTLVENHITYTHDNARELLRRWTDHPQRLWDAVAETLERGIETVIHVGPEPNLLPATFERLKENILAETRASKGLSAVASLVRHPWIAALLPDRAALLRAPLIKHVVLEDWLIEHAPKVSETTTVP